MSKISSRLHEEATLLGYKELAKVLDITPMAAWKKINKKQYTLLDADKVFNGMVILNRQG